MFFVLHSIANHRRRTDELAVVWPESYYHSRARSITDSYKSHYVMPFLLNIANDEAGDQMYSTCWILFCS